ncbi:MAG TPA: hypothetical protein VGS11_10830 [Candidatus Bathyarchaeia archaeon]|nr:hypothetical protein [Candidatus Bathyarchaeia archaeon]
MSFRTRKKGSQAQKGKVFPVDQTAFGPPEHPQLAKEVHAESQADARRSVQELERDFNSAKTDTKKEEIRKATQLEANRLDIGAHNANNSVEARESLAKRAMIFEGAAQRMKRDLQKRRDQEVHAAQAKVEGKASDSDVEIPYNRLNDEGTTILGDRLVVWHGRTYTTREDLKTFPDKIHLIPDKGTRLGLPPAKSEYDQKANGFLEKNDISYRTKYVGDEPFPGEPNGEEHATYMVTFSKPGGKRVSYRFHTSLQDTRTKTPDTGAPTPYDVLAAIEKNDPGTFEDFASEFGYDTDSRKAETTYRAVTKEYQKTSNFFTPQQLEEAQEIS